jgi:hypothetical protein
VERKGFLLFRGKPETGRKHGNGNIIIQNRKNNSANGTTFSGGIDAEMKFPFPANMEFPFWVDVHV